MKVMLKYGSNSFFKTSRHLRFLAALLIIDPALLH